MKSKPSVMKDFEFVDEGRKFFCTVEVPRQAGMQPWWWFRLDTNESTRYAPFEASPNDTEQSVRERIIVYYAALVATLARPAYQKPAWQKPKPAAVAGEIVPVV